MYVCNLDCLEHPKMHVKQFRMRALNSCEFGILGCLGQFQSHV